MLKIIRDQDGTQTWTIVPDTIANGAHPYKTGICGFHGDTLFHTDTGECVFCQNEPKIKKLFVKETQFDTDKGSAEFIYGKTKSYEDLEEELRSLRRAAYSALRDCGYNDTQACKLLKLDNV